MQTDGLQAIQLAATSKAIVTEFAMSEDKKHGPYSLIVNKHQKTWPTRHIKGADIKALAGSPTDWVVNLIVPGPGDDPEIADQQEVDLDHDAHPKGEKRFTTRKPATSPGA